jgi:hypothetical protein
MMFRLCFARQDTVKFCPKAARYKELAWAPETATPERLAFERWREVCLAGRSALHKTWHMAIVWSFLKAACM